MGLGKAGHTFDHDDRDTLFPDEAAQGTSPAAAPKPLVPVHRPRKRYTNPAQPGAVNLEYTPEWLRGKMGKMFPIYGQCNLPLQTVGTQAYVLIDMDGNVHATFVVCNGGVFVLSSSEDYGPHEILKGKLDIVGGYHLAPRSSEDGQQLIIQTDQEPVVLAELTEGTLKFAPPPPVFSGTGRSVVPASAPPVVETKGRLRAALERLLGRK